MSNFVIKVFRNEEIEEGQEGRDWTMEEGGEVELGSLKIIGSYKPGERAC